MASIQQERREIADALRAQAAQKKLPRLALEQTEIDAAVAFHLYQAHLIVVRLNKADAQLHALNTSQAAMATAHAEYARMLADPNVIDAARRAYGVEDGTISSHAADGVV